MIRRPTRSTRTDTLLPYTGSSDLADSLAIDGEFADGLSASGDNLVMRALTLLRARYGADRVSPLAENLTKTLPVAAGSGGGTVDAAAIATPGRRDALPAIGDAPLVRIVRLPGTHDDPFGVVGAPL